MTHMQESLSSFSLRRYYQPYTGKSVQASFQKITSITESRATKK
uniref:Uncharacterized protein n=1 Tax=Arundo donax TaxID=35708 RepID=A0A0A9DA46_ARUDO